MAVEWIDKVGSLFVEILRGDLKLGSLAFLGTEKGLEIWGEWEAIK